MICTGDIISYGNYVLSIPGGKKVKLSFSGAEYFDRMKKSGLYSINNEEIKNRVKNSGLENIFDKKLF